MRFLLVFLVACVSTEAPTTSGIRSDLAGHLTSATVALVDTDHNGELFAFCSGVLLPGNRVITAAHCLDDSSTGMWVATESSLAEENAVMFFPEVVDVPHDLAVLQSNAVLEGAHPAAVSSYSPNRGEVVIVVGHPAGLGWTMTTGIVSHPKRYGMAFPNQGNDMYYLQHQAPIHPGNSGGGVFNENGELVAIVSGGIRGAGHLAFSVHLDFIRRIVEL